MQEYHLETLENILKALGAAEPFTQDGKAFTADGLEAFKKFFYIMNEAAYMGIADDDDIYDFVSEMEDFFGIELISDEE